jgi:hypothetical protein
MKLKDLTDKDLKDLKDLVELGESLRNIHSWMILRDIQYKEAVEKGLPFFSEAELEEIEYNPHHKNGITFGEIEKILSKKGMILKLPTYKRYIGLKLIPESTGRKMVKKKRVGFYPVSVIRKINFIKYVLFANMDFEKSLSRFQITAYEAAAYPGEDFMMTEFRDGSARPAILRCLSTLYRKNVIDEANYKKIQELVCETERELINARDKFHEVEDLLKGIKIDGILGLRMILEEK